jgi:hypothetical protein
MSPVSLLLVAIALALAIAASVAPPLTAVQLAAAAWNVGVALRNRDR